MFFVCLFFTWTFLLHYIFFIRQIFNPVSVLNILSRIFHVQKRRVVLYHLWVKTLHQLLIETGISYAL